MAVRKCPRCELNYIRGDAPYCDVCMSELRREKKSKPAEQSAEPILCSECGENPALPGRELCEACLREQRRQRELEFADNSEEEDDEDEEEEM